MLLRVVTLTGAGAVVGIAACSSSSNSTFHGFVATPDDGGGSDAVVGGGSVGGFYCDACGVGNDASDAMPDAGIEGAPEAEADAAGDVVTGVVVQPDAGDDG